jgi:hypothetical protein
MGERAPAAHRQAADYGRKRAPVHESGTTTVPHANHDNNQHSFNENIRLQNLWDGIELMAALLTM